MAENFFVLNKAIHFFNVSFNNRLQLLPDLGRCGSRIPAGYHATHNTSHLVAISNNVVSKLITEKKITRLANCCFEIRHFFQRKIKNSYCRKLLKTIQISIFV